MVENTPEGPADPVLAQLAMQFPETAARFRKETTLPATVTPGAAGEVSPDLESYPVLEPSAPTMERRRAEGAAAAEREATRREAAERARVDDARADRSRSRIIKMRRWVFSAPTRPRRRRMLGRVSVAAVMGSRRRIGMRWSA
jgi:hypothetical protein